MSQVSWTATGVNEELGAPPALRTRPGQRSAERLPPRLSAKKAILLGGGEGVGRAVALAYAVEGADVAIIDLVGARSHDTVERIERAGGRVVAITSGLTRAGCFAAMRSALEALGGVDVLVNNAACSESLGADQHDDAARALATGWLTLAAVEALRPGASIIISGAAPKPTGGLLSRARTGLATCARLLAAALLPRGIRVNAVLPGPVWSPVAAPVERDAAPGVVYERRTRSDDIALPYVFLASADSSSWTGEVFAATTYRP